MPRPPVPFGAERLGPLFAMATLRAASSHGEVFPMFTLPLRAFLEMRELRKHEILLTSGALRKFHSRMGKAMFISHQWLTANHPDPSGQQFQVLQKALRNLISGRSVVSVPPAIEIAIGRSKCPKATDFQAQELFLWYDYFSCPQGEGWAATGSRQLAIASIPTYVERCFFFVILCPAVSHEDGKALGHSTWAGRVGIPLVHEAFHRFCADSLA